MAQGFFNATPANTGCGFFPSFNSKEGSFYLRFIRQTGWNAEKRSGSFQGGKMLTTKFSPDEMAEMVFAVSNKSRCSFYHAFGENVTSGSFAYLEKDMEVKGKMIKKTGFVLSVKSGEDEYRMAFTNGSATRFAEFIKFGLGHIFQADYAADKKAWEDKQKAKTSPKVPKKSNSIKDEYIAPENEPEPENNDDGEVVEDDVAF